MKPAENTAKKAPKTVIGLNHARAPAGVGYGRGHARANQCGCLGSLSDSSPFASIGGA